MTQEEMMSQSREWWMDMGVIHKERGQYAEAEAYLTGAVTKDRNYGDAWFNLGSLLMRQLDRHAEAFDCFQHAIRCNPTDQVAMMYAAEALQRQDSVAGLLKAIKLLTEMLEKNSNLPRVRKMLGDLNTAWTAHFARMGNM